MKCKRISFPAMFRDAYGPSRIERAAFALGPGPCGKDVVDLSYTYNDLGDLHITQLCSDGSRKVFHYKRDQLTGRVEAEEHILQ